MIINEDSQQQLHNEISQEFMHLATYLKGLGDEFAYGKTYELNRKFEEYVSNQILLNRKQEEIAIPL